MQYEPEKTIIFGSYVRDEMDEYSDLDFVVIKKTEKRFIERFIERVLKEGRILYENT